MYIIDEADVNAKDIHAGIECLPADEECTIECNLQSRTLCEIKIEGCLIVEGHLIID